MTAPDRGGLGCIPDAGSPSDIFYDCLVAEMTASVGGEAVFGLIGASVLLLGLYIAGSGDMAVPTVTVILLGGFLIPSLPAQYTSMAYAVAVVGVAAAVFTVASRWVIE